MLRTRIAVVNHVWLRDPLYGEWEIPEWTKSIPTDYGPMSIAAVFKFSPGKMVLENKCGFGDESVTVQAIVNVEFDGSKIIAKDGMAAKKNFYKNQFNCNASLDAGIYEYQIDGDTMTMRVGDQTIKLKRRL